MKHPIGIFATIFTLLVCGTASAKFIRTDAWSAPANTSAFPELDLASLDPGVSDPMYPVSSGFASPSSALYTLTDFGPLRDQGIGSGALVSETNGKYNAFDESFSGFGGPIAIIFAYTLAQTGDTVAGVTATAADETVGGAYLGGDTEIEFDYYESQFESPLNTMNGLKQGPASFTYGGVTFQSIGNSTPVDSANDFFFNSAGQFVGYLNDNGIYVASSTMSPATGWRAVAAPEIEPKSVASALTLLAGSLSVLLAGRRRAYAKLPDFNR
jgi:hypothetical protein